MAKGGPGVAMTFFQHCFPPGLKEVVEKVPTDVLIGQMYQQKFEALLLEVELLSRLRLTYHNYESVEAEKDLAWKVRDEAALAKEAAEREVEVWKGRVREQGEELEGVRQELMRERLKTGELELARKKWEEEAVSLRDRYETPEGLINAATEKAVVTSFFKDERCYRLFSRVAAPIAGDTLAVLRDHIQQTDPSFQLPEQFKALAMRSEGNVYPWEGGPFDFDELIAQTGQKQEDSGEGVEEGEVAPREEMVGGEEGESNVIGGSRKMYDDVYIYFVKLM